MFEIKKLERSFRESANLMSTTQGKAFPPAFSISSATVNIVPEGNFGLERSIFTKGNSDLAINNKHRKLAWGGRGSCQLGSEGQLGGSLGAAWGAAGGAGLIIISLTRKLGVRCGSFSSNDNVGTISRTLHCYCCPNPSTSTTDEDGPPC